MLVCMRVGLFFVCVFFNQTENDKELKFGTHSHRAYLKYQNQREASSRLRIFIVSLVNVSVGLWVCTGPPGLTKTSLLFFFSKK